MPGGAAGCALQSRRIFSLPALRRGGSLRGLPGAICRASRGPARGTAGGRQRGKLLFPSRKKSGSGVRILRALSLRALRPELLRAPHLSKLPGCRQKKRRAGKPGSLSLLMERSRPGAQHRSDHGLAHHMRHRASIHRRRADRFAKATESHRAAPHPDNDAGAHLFCGGNLRVDMV